MLNAVSCTAVQDLVAGPRAANRSGQGNLFRAGDIDFCLFDFHQGIDKSVMLAEMHCDAPCILAKAVVDDKTQQSGLQKSWVGAVKVVGREGSVRERGGLFHRVGGVTGVAIEDVGLWWSCELQPLTEETPDDRDQYDAD